MKSYAGFSESFPGVTVLYGMCLRHKIMVAGAIGLRGLLTADCGYTEQPLCVECMSKAIEEMYEDKNRT